MDTAAGPAPVPADTRATRITLAEPGDAFAIAALHLQHDVAAGARPESGFLDRYADWWLARRAERPAWLATRADGDPVGVLGALIVDDRPAVGRVPRSWLHLTFLFVAPRARREGVASALVTSAQTWAGARDVERVAVRTTDAGRGVYARAGFGPAGDHLAWRPVTS